MNKYFLSGIIVGSALAGIGIGYFLRDEKMKEFKYIVKSEIKKHLTKKCTCEDECTCETEHQYFV